MKEKQKDVKCFFQWAKNERSGCFFSLELENASYVFVFGFEHPITFQTRLKKIGSAVSSTFLGPGFFYDSFLRHDSSLKFEIGRNNLLFVFFHIFEKGAC